MNNKPLPIEQVDPELAEFIYQIAQGQLKVAIENNKVYDLQGGGRFPVEVLGDPNPGRNEPCPCGSGKKYNRCCNR